MPANNRSDNPIEFGDEWLEKLLASNEPLDSDEVIHVIRKKYSREFPLPSETLLDCLSELGKLNNPKTTLDPFCGLGLVLGKCDYVVSKKGYERNEFARRLAGKLYPDIELTLGRVSYQTIGKFDLVISAPPIESHELNDFLSNSLPLLNKNGLLVVATSRNVLTAPLFENFRNKVLEKYALDAVVSMPIQSGYTDVLIPIEILVIRNGLPKETTLLASLEDKTILDVIADIKNGKGEYQVPKASLSKRWDRHFHDPKHKQIDDYLSQFEVKRMDELAIISRGYLLNSRNETPGDYYLISPRNIRTGEIVIDDRTKKIKPVSRQDVFIHEGDLLVSMIGEPIVYLVKSDDPPFVPNQHFAVIRSNSNKYIATFLRTQNGSSLFRDQLNRKSRGSSLRFNNIEDLRAIRIPIFDIDDLNKLSDEEIKNSSKEKLETYMQLVRAWSLGFANKSAETNTFGVGNEYLRSKEILFVSSLYSKMENLLTEQLGPVHKQLKEVKAEVRIVGGKVDNVLSLLGEMRSDIKSIQSLQREDEEKIILIGSKLDTFSERLGQEQKDLSDYEKIVRQWLEEFAILEEKSKIFLTTAEYIYDQIVDISAGDYSPFVIQYTRALESEFLSKMFSVYLTNVQNRFINLNEFLSEDSKRGSKTKKFAGKIKENKSDFTLGEMKYTLSQLNTDSSDYQNSPLLQDFRKFILDNFQELIIGTEYLGDLKFVTDEYRNKAAHPYLLDAQAALECRMKIRDMMNKYFEYYSPKNEGQQ